jgi:hypothetical protein
MLGDGDGMTAAAQTELRAERMPRDRVRHVVEPVSHVA